MGRTFSVILFFALWWNLFTLTINAQSVKIDSLKKCLKTAQNDSSRLILLNNISALFNNYNLDSAKFYIDKTSALINNFKGTRLEEQYLDHKGNYFQKKGDFKHAEMNFLLSARLAEKLNLKEDYFIAQNSLQLINSKLGNHKKAISELKKLIPLVNQLNDEKKFVTLYSNIAMNFLLLNLPDSAKKYFDIVYPLTEENGFYRAAISVNLAYLNYLTGNYDNTIKYAKESVPIARRLKRTELLLESLTNISNAYYEKKQYAKAVEYSTKVMNIAKKNKLRKQLADAYGNLALAYAGLNDFRTAYKFNNMYSELHDSLFNAELGKQINELQIKYETEKKDKKIKLKDAALKRQSLKLKYSVLAVIVTTIFAIIIFIFYRKKNYAYKELVRRNMEIVEKNGFTPKRKSLPLDRTMSKYSSSSLKDEKKEELHEKLEKSMIEEKLYLKSNLTLGKLAQQLDVNSKYLSQVIHEEYDSGFSDFINKLRVQEAARLLVNKSYRHISIEGISKLVGFTSKSTFNSAFKKIMGVTPSFYSETSKDIK